MSRLSRMRNLRPCPECGADVKFKRCACYRRMAALVSLGLSGPQRQRRTLLPDSRKLKHHYAPGDEVTIGDEHHVCTAVGEFTDAEGTVTEVVVVNGPGVAEK